MSATGLTASYSTGIEHTRIKINVRSCYSGLCVTLWHKCQVRSFAHSKDMAEPGNFKMHDKTLTMSV